MGVIKNEVGRPTNKSIMIRRILKLILLLVIVAGVFCAGYYIKDKEDANKKKESASKKERIVVSKDEANKLMEDTFSYWKYIMVFGGVDAFNKDEYKTAAAIELTHTMVNPLSICDLYKCENKKEQDEVHTYIKIGKDSFPDYSYNSMHKENDVAETFKSKFKTGKIYKDKIIVFLSEYLYNKEQNVYSKFILEGGDGPGPVVGIYEAYKQDNKLYVVIAYNELKFTDDSEFIILTDGEKINVTDYEYDYEKIISKYGDKLEHYKLEFEKSNDSYKFVQSKKIK